MTSSLMILISLFIFNNEIFRITYVPHGTIYFLSIVFVVSYYIEL